MRPVLLRWLVSALCLALTVVIVPHVFFSGDYRILSWLLISAVFGLLLAFVKPLVQLVLLPLIFVSFGLVVVLINTIVIWALALIFPQRFQVEHLLWALLAGLVSGLLIASARERVRPDAAHRPGRDRGAADPDRRARSPATWRASCSTRR